MRRLAWLGFFALAGCGGGQRDLMPLDVGRSWTYHVTTGLESRVKTVKAVRPVAIEGVDGMELNGELGVSRLAWHGNSLVAESTCNLRFSPALPLLVQNEKHVSWTGYVTWMGRAIPCSADVTQKQQAITLVARTIESVESDVVLRLPSRAITLVTWFEPGVGIVKQEQRTGQKLDLGLEMVEGP